MVSALQGVLLECDVPTKEFILNLNDKKPEKEKFVVEDLDETRLFVKAHITEWLEQKLAEFQEQNTYQIARELVAKRLKERALLALKKRKLHEQQFDRLGTWQLNVEQLLSNIEVAKQQKQLFTALKAGNAAVTEMQKEVTLEDVEQLMEDSAQAQAYQERMEEALAGTLTPEQDESARDELAAMQAQLEDEQQLEQAAALPSVSKQPAQPPAVPADIAEEKELPSVPQHAAEAQPEARQTEEPIVAE